MIKLDMHLCKNSSVSDNDWKATVVDVKTRREHIEREAEAYHKNGGEYIRPIALIQVERTGKDQRGGGFVHSEDVREFLCRDQKVDPAEVAVKSSAKNEIKNKDLLSPSCCIRFIITKQALSEGWDCPFAYVLGIIPDSKSNQSATQLIGRVLRQPRARKTGIPILDESYVYYTRRNTNELLECVRKGFAREGLEDLMSSVREESNDKGTLGSEVKIKDEFSKYEYSFYLPVWLSVKGSDGTRRRFCYHTDICAAVDFGDFALSEESMKEIANSLSEKERKGAHHIATINDESKTEVQEVSGHDQEGISDGFGYMARRISEHVGNAFLAWKIASRIFEQLTSQIDNLSKHLLYITSFVTKKLEEEKKRREEEVFRSLLQENCIELAVCDDRLGFKIPKHRKAAQEESVERHNYKKNLYNGVDASSLNSLEKKVASLLDEQEKLLWWFKNGVSRHSYAIQGWRKDKIRPDFIAAKKKERDEVEIVYVLESKGKHLVGNEDTTYKKSVMDEMTEIGRRGEIKVHQTEIPFPLNDAVEAHLIEEEQEESEISKLFK